MRQEKKKEWNAAIVLAAGKGSRMNSSVQKQYLHIGNKPVLYYSLKQFEAFEGVDEIILVTGEDEREFCRKEIVEAYGIKKVSRIVAGGKERYHSVYQGLCAAGDCDYVYIHDGARPFLNREILERLQKEVHCCEACVAAMPVKDTIKLADEKAFALQTPDRRRLWMVQTPQVFRCSMIREAYEELMKRELPGITDDAMVLEKITGRKVKLVEGSYRNMKITTPEDLLVAEAFLRSEEETGKK